MADTDAFQLSIDAAESYESAFVPALFEPWAKIVVDAAGLRSGDRILDVACGTGIVARIAADIVGAKGSVVGIDRNPAMLAIADRLRPDIEWRRGDASGLPFLARSFDVVTCQAALMFFSDPARAIKEMARAIKDDGTVVIQIWDRLDDQPAYLPFIEAAARSLGSEATNLLAYSFARGDLSELRGLLCAGGLRPDNIDAHTTIMRFGSVDEFVMTEVQSTPLGERLSGEIVERIVEDARDALRMFTSPDGALHLPIRGHVIKATLRARSRGLASTGVGATLG